MLWEQQPRSHLDTDTRARESGRRKGLRRRRPTRAGTSAWHQHQKRRDSTGDEKNTPASGRPPAHSSVSRSVLIGWLTWFGNEVPFYNSARDSSQSLAIQYNVLIAFFKTKKAGELSGAHLVSAYFWLSEHCCWSPCALEQVSVPLEEKRRSERIQRVSC